MRTWLTILTLFAVGGCNRDKFSVENYLDTQQMRSVLVQVVRHVAVPDGVPIKERFDLKYLPRYNAVISSYHFTRYFVAPDGTHYFLLIRPYLHHKKRAVGGRMTLDANLRVVRFTEDFVTPLLSESDAMERGEFLFEQLATSGVLSDKYLKMKSFVEWPDGNTVYDTSIFEWRLRDDL